MAQTIKIGRNEPCYCGSGKKHKHCCLPKLQAEQAERMRIMEGRKDLKNKFRDEMKNEGKSLIEIEAEKVGEAEMLRRDQFATMRQLRVQRDMQQSDAVYTEAAIEKYREFLEELAGLPLSQAREGIAGMITKQIEALKNQLAASTFPRPNEVTLAALEALFTEFTKRVSDDTSEALRDEEESALDIN